uniref:AAA+ ATPase domain-containing protein n=1 Tax=Arundo donax TaxID=35708 RepID=A0A0A9FIB6_ARUDO
MDLVTRAIGNLVPKLHKLLRDEYKLQKGVKAQIESLKRELESMQIALRTVAQVPHDKLHPQVKLWARDVREASYDMEDVLDTFLVRVDGGHQSADADKAKVKHLLERMGKMFSLSKIKARHEIASAIVGIKKQVEEIAKRRDRYRVDDLVANPAAAASIDPRLSSLYTKASELVAIDEPRDELIKMLDASEKEMKIVSVVGSGGLGKTTLAKAVYDKITTDMNISCKAFVPVGQNPDLKKVFRDILLALDKERYTNKTNFMILDERQLMDEIQEFLKEKRYFIVIDDIWEVQLWNKIRIALDDNNLGSKIIITTRCSDIAKQVPCSYKIKPLPPKSSKILFHGRIFGSVDNCPEQFSKLSEIILKKCGGVPLAIVTMSSLLANKSHDVTQWQVVCDSIGSGLSGSDYVHTMRKILSLSYFDLPSHIKTCFLYLSIYPEDYLIWKDQLIWRWIAEGFIKTSTNDDNLFEVGESYFNELINRSLVQPVYDPIDDRMIIGCRVHDMILDLICSLSREENFVTMSDDIDLKLSLGNKPRRLSLKDTTWPQTGMSQVRSIAIFHPSIGSVPSFSCFDVLRVLDLEGCSVKNEDHRKLDVGNLIHLRYLRLSGRIMLPPEGIEKLQFLQILRMGQFVSGDLAQRIFGLRRLMCLEADGIYPRPGNLLRNLASLQVLRELRVDEESVGAVEELGHLTQLRELTIRIHVQMDQSLCDAFINSLGNLRKLQYLVIRHPQPNDNPIKWQRWAPPPHLRLLMLTSVDSFPTLPKWISPASLPLLSTLCLTYVDNVRPEDIQVLGTLPALCWFYLGAKSGNLERPLQRFVVSAGAFPRATFCRFDNVVTLPSMFPRGAMPRVEVLELGLRMRDFISNGGFDFNELAMGHFPSLPGVLCGLYGSVNGEEGVTKVQQALRHAAEVHPIHPSIGFHCEKDDDY